ncbi:hypothetical protein D3C80_1091940 [compost metagenome]
MISWRFRLATGTSRARATKYQASVTKPLPKAVCGAAGGAAFASGAGDDGWTGSAAAVFMPLLYQRDAASVLTDLTENFTLQS